MTLRRFMNWPGCLRLLFVCSMLGCISSPARAASTACPEGMLCEPGGPSTPGHQQADLQFEVPPPPPPLRRRRLHAASLRLSQLFTTDTSSIEGLHLTGLGLSFRLRPMAWLGVEPGLDLYRGYDGFDALHTETSVSTDLLFYLNPRQAVQFFGLAGLSLGFARHSESWAHSETSNLAARLGMGLEFRITHLVSFSVNAVGFSRQLTGAKLREGAADDRASVPRTVRGGLLQAGASLYF